MFNPFGRGGTPGELHLQRSNKTEVASVLISKLEAFREFKSLENNLNFHCMKRCLALEKEDLDEKEMQCLSNCKEKALVLV